MAGRIKNFHIGIHEVDLKTFYVEVNIEGYKDFDVLEEELYKSKHFRGVTRTEKPNIILIGVKEFFEDSIANFVDGKYSKMYPEDQALVSFINFPEAINVLTKEPFVDIDNKVYDRKKEMEEQLDVVISSSAELDSPPNIDEEIYDGSITPLL